MSTWLVYVRREVCEYIQVEADHAEQAGHRALESVDDVDWDDETEPRYEVLAVEPK